MADIMQKLSRDHANIALMMTLLDSELDAVHEMENADFELMHDIMLYMTAYPDRIHHPMEDLVFDRLPDGDRELLEAAAALREEHIELSRKGQAFHGMLTRVVDGLMVERKVLEAQGRDYVTLMRGHMTRENEDVFPSAERLLGIADWESVSRSLDAQEDPVFGPIVHEQFTELFEHIRTKQGERRTR